MLGSPFQRALQYLDTKLLVRIALETRYGAHYDQEQVGCGSLCVLPRADPELPLHGCHVIHYHTKRYFSTARGKSGRHVLCLLSVQNVSQTVARFFPRAVLRIGDACTTTLRYALYILACEPSSFIV
jgi:hypothetical protein